MELTSLFLHCGDTDGGLFVSRSIAGDHIRAFYSKSDALKYLPIHGGDSGKEKLARAERQIRNSKLRDKSILSSVLIQGPIAWKISDALRSLHDEDVIAAAEIDGDYDWAACIPGTTHAAGAAQDGLYALQRKGEFRVFVVYSKEQAMEVINDYMREDDRSHYRISVQASRWPDKSEKPPLQVVGHAAMGIAIALNLFEKRRKLEDALKDDEVSDEELLKNLVPGSRPGQKRQEQAL